MRVSKFTLFSIVLLVLGGVWIAISATTAASASIQAPRQGFAAPDFTLSTSLNEPLALSELRGRPVLINVWASWCSPCKEEIPALEAAWQQYRPTGFVVLGINSTFQDDLSHAVAFATKEGITYPVLLDKDGTFSRLYQVRALPTSFFIDANGVIQEVIVGGPMAPALLSERIESLLAIQSKGGE
jgi:peroxiredoxin